MVKFLILLLSPIAQNAYITFISSRYHVFSYNNKQKFLSMFLDNYSGLPIFF